MCASNVLAVSRSIEWVHVLRRRYTNRRPLKMMHLTCLHPNALVELIGRNTRRDFRLENLQVHWNNVTQAGAVYICQRFLAPNNFAERTINNWLFTNGYTYGDVLLGQIIDR